MYCKECGSELSEGAIFCGSCGEKAQPLEEATVMEAKSVPDESIVVGSYTTQAEDHEPLPTREESADKSTATVQERFNQTDQRAVESPVRKVDSRELPMTLGAWIGTFLLLLIPVVNIVLPFVWAFGSDVNRSKKTFFQAMLLVNLVMIVLFIVFSSAIAIFFATFSEGVFY